MKKTSTLIALVTVIVAPVCLAHAQRQATVPRIGILRAGAPPPPGSPDLKTAKAIGLTMPTNILARADRVIK